MAQRFFLALLALRLALACREEACEGDEGASLMQLQQPKQQVELVSLSSLESRKFLQDFRCLGSTPPTFYARLDGRKISKASLPVNVSAGSELVILGCNLEVGALGNGPMVNELGEDARLSVLFYGSFNKKVVGEDYAPFGQLPEETALFVESESARFEGRLADAQSRWAARGDGCPEQAASGLIQVAGEVAGAKGEARSDDNDEGHSSLLEKKEKAKQAKKAKKAKKKAERAEKAKKAAVVVPQFLFPPVLVGPVGSGARVEITVKESANVEVRGGSLTVSGGNNSGASLMGPMVRAEGTLENVVMRINVQESAKADADREVLVWDGYLIARVLRADGYNLSDIQVTLEEVANVNARNVTIVAAASGTALTATVFAGDDDGITESDAHLSMQDSANIHARNLRFVGFDREDAVVMNEIMAFPTRGLNSQLSTVLKETGNAHLKGSILGRGHLFDEVMDFGDFESCKVEAYLEESGNAYAASRVSEGNPPWINDIVQLNDANDTAVKVKMEESSNQRIGLLEVVRGITVAGFLDDVVTVLNDIALLQNASFDVRIDDSLNWYGEVLDMRNTNSELLEIALEIDSSIEGSSIEVFMSKSANAFGDPKSAVCIDDELIFNVADLQTMADSSVSVRVLDSANVEANYFYMSQEDLIDTVLAANDLVQRSSISLKVERSSNGKAATVNITDGGHLLEYAISTENLAGAETTVSVYVSESANVAAYTLNMEDSSYLIDHGASLEFRSNPSAQNISVDLNFIGSGSALVKQATLSQQSRLINDVLQIDDRTRDLPSTKLLVKECGNLAVQKASRLRGGSFLIGNFVEMPGNASTLEKLEVLFSGVAKGPVTFSNNSDNCRDDFEVHPSSCRGPR